MTVSGQWSGCSECSDGACGAGGCCAGVRTVTPRTLYNRPGLPAIDYRAGTHAGFLESMIARLANRPELTGYTTRDPSDPGIALLDCWALIGDIVTFYSERAANEGFLSTATLPDSLTRLGRLVNYQPRPAVGASGYLAFTMDPGAAGVIPAGTQARSVAAQNQLPQTFETAEAITARADWNELAVRQTQPSALSAAKMKEYDQLTFTGTSLGVQAGARLVFDFGPGAAPGLAVVTAATPDFAAGHTVVDLVPSGPVGLAAAVNRLATLIGDAQHRAAANGLSGLAVVQGINSVISGPEMLGMRDPAAGDDDFNIMAGLVQGLAEWLAITAHRVPSQVAAWLGSSIRPVQAQAARTLRLMAADERRLAPDIDYLQRLAHKLTCQEDAGGRAAAGSGRGGGGDCDRAASLATAAAIMPALRRPPSRPPALPVALPQAASTALDPQSAVVTTLLTAADPRLAGLLTEAIGRQTATRPPATGGVTLLTAKANAVADEGDRLAGANDTVLLDGTPSSLVPGSWLVSEVRGDSASPHIARIKTVVRYSRKVTLSSPAGRGTGTSGASGGAQAPQASARPGAVTTYVPTAKVIVDGADGTVWTGKTYPFADITIYYGGTPLQLADEPMTQDVSGGEIQLARAYDGLYPGQRLIVTGERTDIPGTHKITASELTMVGGVRQHVNTTLAGDTTLPVLVLATPLAYTYKRATVTISGNVAAATQGETRTEVLGSGAAGLAGQAFPLKQVAGTSPLTWLPSDNALGAADTLTVRVNGMRWHETDDLSQAGPQDTEYRLVLAEDAGASVAFGDGVHGSRLPTGQENVTAAYRTGGGNGGNLPAQRITQLASRPLGVNAVTNPLPTTGGADGDTPGDIRHNAALSCLALDRLLSAQDYADFTAARAGIGKAAATALSDGCQEVIYVTIAGAGDVPVDTSDLLVTQLRQALAELGDPYLPVQVGVRELLLIVMSAGIKVGADYSYDLVEPAVRAAALAAGGFGSHALGQSVYLSGIVAAMQAVPGVDYVEVDLFDALPGTTDPLHLLKALLSLADAKSSSRVKQRITVKPARLEQDVHPVGADPTGVPDTLTSIALQYGTTLDALAALNPRLTSITLQPGDQITVASGIRPAQLARFSPDIPQTLLLRSIP